MTLSNEKVMVSFNQETKEIFGRDLTDRNNDPAFYNQTVRGISKAWTYIEKAFGDETVKSALTASTIMNILREHGVRTHYYCMMD